jgi:uncharacterized protein (DUF2249 family)
MSKVTQAIHDHHEKVIHSLSGLVVGLTKDAPEAVADELVEFLKRDLIPHTTGEEAHLYPLIDALTKEYGKATATMVIDHELIRDYAHQIDESVRALRSAAAPDRRSIVDEIQRVCQLLHLALQFHLEKEERVYMPLVERYASEFQQQQALERMHATSVELSEGPSQQAEVRIKTSLDVRPLAARKRHPLIFQTFEALEPGEAFVLINDHDPKPLYYQFKAEREGRFSWDYLEQGPEVWRVRIGRIQP